MKKYELTLEQHQSYIYDILYMIDDFCKSHEIEYFLVGGTLLGAARHQGIIPWDDDADIAMTRKNYEKFVKLYRQEQPEGYPIFDFYHEDWYDLPFAKITKANTLMRQAIEKIPALGICVDVFVVDGCGNGLEFAQEYFLKTSDRIINTHFCFWGDPKVNFNMWKSKLIYYFKIKPISFFTPFKKWYLERIYKTAKQYSVEDSEYSAIVVNGLYGVGEVQPSISYTHLDELTFGVRKLPVPSMWHEYLTGIYNDYMTPPPTSEIHRHCLGTSYLLID